MVVGAEPGLELRRQEDDVVGARSSPTSSCLAVAGAIQGSQRRTVRTMMIEQRRCAERPQRLVAQERAATPSLGAVSRDVDR